MNEEMASPVTALGWALIHFLWQGALLGLVTAFALTWLRGARPQSRYALACGSLLLCVAFPAVAICHGLFATTLPVTPQAAIRIMPASWQSTLQGRLPWIVGVWALGSGLLAVRMALGLAWIGRIRRTSEAAVERRWQAQLERLAARLGLRRPVTLRLVADLESPVAAGFWRPVVLVPASLLSRMPADLLEALLAHELAHLKRWDYLVNLVQSAIETLLFYHPAVWWISKQIRIEREQIADDLAAAALGEPRRLAIALQELDLFQASRLRLAQAARGGNLLSRIQRLARPRPWPATPAAHWRMAFSMLSLALVCGVCTAACLGTPGTFDEVAAPGQRLGVESRSIAAAAEVGTSEATAPDSRDAPAPVSGPDAVSEPAPLDEPDAPDI